MKRLLTSLVLAALLSMTVLGVALADPGTTVITESEIVRQAEGTPPANDWVLYTRNAGQGTFVDGPDSPPLGTGSLNLTTAASSDKIWLFNYDHAGTPLSSIGAIGYSTYRNAGNDHQVTALNIEVDFNGPDVAGGYTVLVFEPVYNTNQGTVVDGVWQAWDAYAGGQATWWSSRAIPGVCAFTCYASWNAIVAANPDATILGGFGVNQGSGNATLNASTDALTIGYAGDTFIYDFELNPPPPPVTTPDGKDDCKKNGWKDVTRADGTAFKNQGDCIQYVNTGK